MLARLPLFLLAAVLSLSAAGLPAVDEAGYAKAVEGQRGKVVLVNFWATWCAPCRKEMPGLAAISKKYAARGMTLLTVSADEPEDAPSAEAFLRKSGVAGPAFLKRTRDDDAFIRALDPKWSGALPATFLYDRQGRKVRSFFGEVELYEVEAAVAKLL
jgi:thiol-disulfide isomerase/thioredoxin